MSSAAHPRLCPRSSRSGRPSGIVSSACEPCRKPHMDTPARSRATKRKEAHVTIASAEPAGVVRRGRGARHLDGAAARPVRREARRVRRRRRHRRRLRPRAVLPADPTARDGFTAFLKQESGGWKQLTGGTAFDQQNARPAGHPGRAARRARRVGDLRLPRDDGRQGDRPACRRRVGVFRIFRKRSDASMCGTPDGIRTRGLHLERVASLATRRRGHARYYSREPRKRKHYAEMNEL